MEHGCRDTPGRTQALLSMQFTRGQPSAPVSPDRDADKAAVSQASRHGTGEDGPLSGSPAPSQLELTLRELMGWIGHCHVLAVKHIPSRCASKTLIEWIVNLGFPDWDFAYIPFGRKGFMLVGFKVLERAAQFRARAQGFLFPPPPKAGAASRPVVVQVARETANIRPQGLHITL